MCWAAARRRVRPTPKSELINAVEPRHCAAGKSHAFCRRATKSVSARPVPGQINNRSAIGTAQLAKVPSFAGGRRSRALPGQCRAK
jgi:hypothetical protein